VPGPDGRTGHAPVRLVAVLLLVIGAAALLVVGLVTRATGWAWVSFAVSTVAGLVLVIDWLTRRTGPGTVRTQVSGAHDDADAPEDVDTPGPPAVERTETAIRRTSPAEVEERGESLTAPGSPRRAMESPGRGESELPVRLRLISPGDDPAITGEPPEERARSGLSRTGRVRPVTAGQ